MEILGQKLLRALRLTNDFFYHIEESTFILKIPNAPSNTIGDQVYCIVGARESYLESMKVGRWTGFSCSLTDCNDKENVAEKMEETYMNTQKYLEDEPINKPDFLFDLLEHEVQHHGQLIRFAYANKISFPKSWNARYTV